jgi:hypothetical protein
MSATARKTLGEGTVVVAPIRGDVLHRHVPIHPTESKTGGIRRWISFHGEPSDSHQSTTRDKGGAGAGSERGRPALLLLLRRWLLRIDQAAFLLRIARPPVRLAQLQRPCLAVLELHIQYRGAGFACRRLVRARGHRRNGGLLPGGIAAPEGHGLCLPGRPRRR